VLQSITLQPPLLVVEVLAPAGIVGTDRLDVPGGYRANPYLFPGRRDHQELATLDLFGGQATPGFVQVDEPLPGAPSGPARVSW
jgi:hypothetical protein